MLDNGQILPRLRTHQYVSAAVVSVVFGILWPHRLLMILPAVIAAGLIDWVIDRFGHTTVYQTGSTGEDTSHSKRARATHSVLTAPVIGVFVGLLGAYAVALVYAFLLTIPSILSGFLSYPSDVSVNQVFSTMIEGGAWFWNNLDFSIVMSIAGMSTGLIHLFLDSFTESGIYMPSGRWSIANVDARDRSLNLTLKLAAVTLIVYVLAARIYLIQTLLPIPLEVIPVIALGLLLGTAVRIVRFKPHPNRADSANRLLSSRPDPLMPESVAIALTVVGCILPVLLSGSVLLALIAFPFALILMAVVIHWIRLRYSYCKVCGRQVPHPSGKSFGRWTCFNCGASNMS